MKLYDLVPSGKSRWFAFPGDPTGQLRFRINYCSPATIDAMQRRSRPARPLDKDETALSKWNEQLEKHALADWEGLLDPQDDEVPYTSKQALAMLQANMELANWVTETCSDIKNFLGEGEPGGSND